MWQPLRLIPSGWPRGLAFAVLFMLTVFLAVKTSIDLKSHHIIALELAGTTSAAEEIISDWKRDGVFEDAIILQWWDDYFLVAYSLTLSLLCVIVADVMHLPQ